MSRARSRLRIFVGAWSLLLASGIVFFYSRPGELAQHREAAAIIDPVHSIQQLLAPDPHALFGKPHLRVLLVGLDYDYDVKDQETSKAARSDVIMAIDLDLIKHHISLLSIPRDMVALLPGGRRAKINEAQSEGGIRESQSVVAQWLGVPKFDRYIQVRINASKDIITALGGVDLNVQNSDILRGQGPNGPLNYDDSWGHLHVHLQPGMQHLNGEEAIGYGRFRHDWCSDPCRIMRQQQLIRAVAQKVQHQQINTLFHLQQLLRVIHDDVNTNLTTQEEVALGVSFAHLRPQEMAAAQIPYSATVMLPDYGDALIPDESAKARLVAAFFPPQPSEATALRVHLQNGTSVAGLAHRFANQLRDKGFDVAEVADALSADFAVTELHAAPGQTVPSARILQALGLTDTAPNIVFDRTSAIADPSEITIVLGRDILGPHQ